MNTNNLDYMPEGYETLLPEKSYIQLSKLAEGEYKYRIVTKAISGWVDWKEKKPYRYRPKERPQHSFDDAKPMKAFWCLYVWDYERKSLFVMEITQASLIKKLKDLGEDSDWGDYRSYDIKIKKEGSGKETKYSLNPVPHKPLLDEITAAVAAKPINLEALYNGGDPWLQIASKEATPVAKESDVIDSKQLEELNGIFARCAPDYLTKTLGHLRKSSAHIESLAQLPVQLYERVKRAGLAKCEDQLSLSAANN